MPAPNGVINVNSGGTLKVEYADASACGVLNVTAQKTVPVNCAGQACTGVVTTDRATYTCNDTMQVTLVDSDIAGAGSKQITIASAQESTPEAITLTETPPASGTRAGSLKDLRVGVTSDNSQIPRPGAP